MNEHPVNTKKLVTTHFLLTVLRYTMQSLPQNFLFVASVGVKKAKKNLETFCMKYRSHNYTFFFERHRGNPSVHVDFSRAQLKDILSRREIKAF